MNENKIELLNKLREYWEKHPDTSFGSIVCYLASIGIGATTQYYDPLCVTDEEMLEALNQLIVP